MNDDTNCSAFQEFLQKRCEEIENSESNIETYNAILKLEKKLIGLAPQNIIDIYFQIDYLNHKQQENFKNSLIKLR